MKEFVAAILIMFMITLLIAVFVVAGVYCLQIGHPVAGGWLIAGGILSGIGTKLTIKHKGENKSD